MNVMAKRAICLATSALITATVLAAQPQASDRGVAHPERWPQGRSAGLVDPATEAFVTELIAKMSLEEKVGQMIQADTSAIKPDDLRKYPLGSILAGATRHMTRGKRRIKDHHRKCPARNLRSVIPADAVAAADGWIARK